MAKILQFKIDVNETFKNAKKDYENDCYRECLKKLNRIPLRNFTPSMASLYKDCSIFLHNSDTALQSAILEINLRGEIEDRTKFYLTLSTALFLKGEMELGDYYLRKPLDEGLFYDEGEVELSFINDIYQDYFKKRTTKRKFFRNTEDEAHILKAQDFLNKNKFSDALLEFKKIKNFDDEDVRRDVYFCYLVLDDIEEGLSFSKTYGKKKSCDLAFKLTAYQEVGDTKNFEKTKEEFLQVSKNSPADYFKVAMIFGQLGEYDVAYDFMKKYFLLNFDKGASLQLYFAITCLNCKKYEEAKATLLNLKDINRFDRPLYDDILQLIDRKQDKSFRYLFCDNPKQIAKNNKKLKNLKNLSDEELVNFLLSSEDEFLNLVNCRNNFDLRLLLLRLKKLNVAGEKKDAITKFLYYILSRNDVDWSVKKQVLLDFLEENPRKTFAVSRGDYLCTYRLCGFVVPEHIKRAILLFFEFILDADINLEIFSHEEIVKKLINLEVFEEENLLAAFISWEFVKDKKRFKKKQILDFFNVEKTTFEEFLDKYNLKNKN